MVSELTKQRVLASMEDDLKQAAKQAWPYIACHKSICDDADQHNRDSAYYAEQRRESYLRTCQRRIDRYRKTGEISGA